MHEDASLELWALLVVLAVKCALCIPGKNIDGVLADPFMMLIPPLEQFSHEYIFSTPDDENKQEFDNFVTFVIENQHVNGIVPPGSTLVVIIVIDGMMTSI